MEGYMLIDGHAKTILASMNNLRSQNQLCDVIILCQNKELPAHRVVLASSSKYFRAMFTNDMSERDQKKVEIKGIAYETMKIMLEFIYTESVRVTVENVQDLLPAACLLQLTGVETACCEFLKRQLDPGNCLGIRSVCRKIVFSTEVPNPEACVFE